MIQWSTLWRFVLQPVLVLVLGSALLYGVNVLRRFELAEAEHAGHLRIEHEYFHELEKWRDLVDQRVTGVEFNTWLICMNQRAVIEKLKVPREAPTCREPVAAPLRERILIPQSETPGGLLFGGIR